MIRFARRPALPTAFLALPLLAFAAQGKTPINPAQAHASTASIAPAQLKTEAANNPLGIDTRQPQLSWTLAAESQTTRSLAQSAYRVLVASSPDLLIQNRGDLWDSGKVASSQPFGIAYQGAPLRSAQTCYWKVAVWDQAGQQSAWSAPARWTTGLLNPGDWSEPGAKWIAASPDTAPKPSQEHFAAEGAYPPPLPIFRRDFRIAKPVKQALAFVSGLGQYDLHVNGESVTSSVLNPGWTNYRKTILYNSRNVTKLLRAGGNTLGVMLGNGMYNVEVTKGRYTKFDGTFGQPKLILELRIEFTDGTSTTIVSDNSWKTSPGPITYTSIYGGEDYDAQREQHGWDTPGFHDAAWSAAVEVGSPGGTLVAQTQPPIEVAHVYSAKTPTQPKPGVLVYDLGQNFSGWPEIIVRGPRGAVVKLTAGELLDANGLVTQHSMNAGPDNADLFNYTLKGEGAETWHPRFSYSGFRYVQVNGASTESTPEVPAIIAVSGQFLHATAPVVGHFTTSNQLFQRIHTLIDMAILSNMVSVLTDCPHREKLGWLEQTHLAGASILYNYDVSDLYAKIARDMRDSQLPDGMVPAIAPEYVAFVDDKGVSNAFRDSPEWGSAAILSPWTAYQFTGNRNLLADNYDSMLRYAAYLRSKLQDGMLTYGLGDWYDIGPNPPGESQLTQKGMTATATYFEDLKALSEIAAILNKPSDAPALLAEAATTRDSINRHLFHPDAHRYDRGSQTANAMPLALGIVPLGEQKPVLDGLVADIEAHQNHVTAGDIGFHYVVRALTDGGRADVLNDMLLRTDSPSYGYQLARGATTLTEAWDTNPDSSQNHFMLGHAEEWFYRGLAGIDFDLSRKAPEQIIIRPSLVKGTNDASATYESVLGLIGSGWSRSGNQVTMDVTIPPGASATVFVPASSGKAIQESGKPLQNSADLHFVANDGAVKCIVGSGHFHFTFTE